MEDQYAFSLVQDVGNGKSVTIRRASKADAYKIQELYYVVYRGSYPLSVINNIDELNDALSSQEFIWAIMESNGEVVGSVVHEVDHAQRIGKSFGAVVLPEFRQHDLTQITMKHVQDMILGKDKSCDLIYATTRTESAAPQKLTERLKYKKLGIFPNVRKVVNYETHCLTAVYDEHAFATRKKPPVILPELKDLYEITRAELGLPHARIEDYICENEIGELVRLEAVSAPNYVKQIFLQGVANKSISIHFYPFHSPNLLLCSKDMKIQMYLYHSPEANHSCIIGGHVEGYEYQTVLESVCAACRNLGIRYMELLADAYRPEMLREILNTRFLPSAYFPALKLVLDDEDPLYKKGERLDYFVFSRSFEMLDFKNIKLEGIYKKYLKYYFKMWRSLYIEDIFED